MSSASKLTFQLCACLVTLAALAGIYLSIRIGSFQAESMSASTRELRFEASRGVWEFRGYFQKLWLLPALATVFSFFGWVEYLRSPSNARRKSDYVWGLVASLSGVGLLATLGALFLVALGGHG